MLDFDYDNYDASKDPLIFGKEPTPKVKRKKNPVDDTELTYNILLCKGKGKLNRIAEKYIIILVEEAIKKIIYKFNNPDDVNDAVQTAYYNILVKWQGFNPDVANSAFTYFTQIQKTSAAEFINKWRDLRGIKKEELNNVKRVSINSSNNGKGLFNI